MSEIADYLIAMMALATVGGLWVLFSIWHNQKKLHAVMNSRLDELITMTRILARAEGFKEGQESERFRGKLDEQ